MDSKEIERIKEYVKQALSTIQPEAFWDDFYLLVTTVEILQAENADLREVSAFNAKQNNLLKHQVITEIDYQRELIETREALMRDRDRLAAECETYKELADKGDLMHPVVEAAKAYVWADHSLECERSASDNFSEALHDLYAKKEEAERTLRRAVAFYLEQKATV